VDTLLHGIAGEKIYGRDMAGWLDNDPAVLAARVKNTSQPIAAIYMDVGNSDPFLHQNEAFDFELRKLGIAHEFHEYPGTHNWRFWSTHVPQSRAWMDSIIGH
jgi:S-formylglutathione hydrolase FrmB